MIAGPYSIGSNHCPGLSKLAEEAGEVVQVIGKIIGHGGFGKHWDGSELKDRLEEEIADVMAACEFVSKVNGLDLHAILARCEKKFELFGKWHDEQRNAPGRHLTDDDAAAIGRSYGIGVEKKPSGKETP